MVQQGFFYNDADVYDVNKAIFKGCDLDQDGRINRKELAVILQLMTLANSGTVPDLQG